MWTYLLFILLILMLSLCIKLTVPNKARQEHLIAKVGMIMIFLLLALKADTVGVDIAGYKEQYELAARMPWDNFSYVYFESGYLFLTKVFSKLGFSFQFFTACLYALLCHSLYLLISRYSPNATLSLLIFICYNFLVFSISGLRQTLATALCVYAFLLGIRYTKKDTVWAIALNVAAVYIHESAIVFFAVLAVLIWMNREMKISVWVLLTAAVFLLRTQVWKIVTYFYGRRITSFNFSGTFIFILGMVVFLSFTYYYYNQRRVILTSGRGRSVKFHYDAFLVRAAFLCLLCQIVFAGGKLLRANMYFTLLLIPGVPLSISKYPYRTRFMLNAAMAGFMIVLFYKECLLSNQLNLWPYRFFWQ